MAKPKFFVIYDRVGKPIRYEAGFFQVDPYGPTTVRYETEEELVAALGGKLEYKGYTSTKGTAMDMLSELFGEDKLSVESATKLKTAFESTQTKASNAEEQNAVLSGVLDEVIVKVYS